MAFSVSQFKSNIASNGGGARASLYKVSIKNSINGDLSFSDNEAILIKATNIPGATIGEEALMYAGRPIKYTGKRTFENWTTTVTNDENFSIRNKMMEWMRKIGGQLDGTRTKAHGAYATEAGRYFEGEAIVTQVGKDGEDKQKFKLNNIWPTSIAAMPVDWSADGIQEFSIEWCFDTVVHTFSV
jgi:hypothetical protein|tara:strand:- start:632 stop:1186 length:555 start_codon:yes stop_codon:yes gene_type:complete